MRSLMSYLAFCTMACSHSGKPVSGTEDAARSWGMLRFGDLEWKSFPGDPGNEGRQYAMLWGKASGPSGILVKAPGNFSSGSHTHTSDYRAFVISGSMTHAVPSEKQPQPMGPGAFWVQPGGSPHVTTCTVPGGCLFYQEFEGARDSLAADTTGTSPGGLTATTILANDIPWWDVPNTHGAVKLAWVWGERESPEPSGFFLKFKAGFPGFPHTHTNDYNGVVVQGRYRHWEIGQKDPPVLPVGTAFWQRGGAAHDDSCDAGAQDCVSYFRIHGKFDVTPFATPADK